MSKPVFLFPPSIQVVSKNWKMKVYTIIVLSMVLLHAWAEIPSVSGMQCQCRKYKNFYDTINFYRIFKQHPAKTQTKCEKMKTKIIQTT